MGGKKFPPIIDFVNRSTFPFSLSPFTFHTLLALCAIEPRL